MILYTGEYPSDIAAFVCVDCRTPEFSTRFADALEATGDNMFAEVIADERSLINDWTFNVERLDIAASNQQVLKVKNLGDRPVVFLVAENVWASAEQTVDQVGSDLWLETNQHACDLSGRCRLEVVPDVDHGTILKHNAVDKAVQEVYDQVVKR
jgi:hypothetical protein